MRTLFALGLTAALAVTVACGDSSSPVSPMAPSVAEAPGAPTAGPTSGALLTGTVTVASGARTVSVRDTAGLAVSVSGTSLSAPVDANGNFAIDGVPPGDLQIKISGSGIDVTLSVNGVQAGQTIRLKITVSGTSGSIDSDLRDGATDSNKRELEGRIETIVDGSSLIVSGQLVTTDASTVIRKGDNTTMSFGDLIVGLRVHVRGTLVSATEPPSLLASEIKVQNTNIDVPMKVEGVVAATPAIDLTSCPSITFALEDRSITVMTSSKTNFKSSCFDIEAGATVEVMGRLQSVVTPTDEPAPPPGSTILADKIEVTKAASTVPPVSGAPELEFKGALSGLAGSCPSITFNVGAGPELISTSSSTSFKPACNALRNGDSLEVKAIKSGDKYLATKVERK